jgi:hypothetical protein
VTFRAQKNFVLIRLQCRISDEERIVIRESNKVCTPADFAQSKPEETCMGCAIEHAAVAAGGTLRARDRDDPGIAGRDLHAGHASRQPQDLLRKA